ncbi:MAG: purine-nucleoside phosphorylase [Clostridiaceae bacterium]
MVYKLVEESVNYIKNHCDIKPEVGIILGSGLGDLADQVKNKVIIDYGKIPNFKQSSVVGHAGRFVIGELENKKVIMMQGRYHYYEGNTMQEVTLPVYVMKELGIDALIVTNAAGGVNTSFVPGDLMIINDHINFTGNNPLIGENDERLGARFPDMSRAYSTLLIEKIKGVAQGSNINLVEGVYAMMTGPSYETPAEIRMLRTIGADAVGMSTVPEVIVANHCKLNVLGISCITNMASGILDQPLNHQEVIEVSNKVKSKFVTLLKETLKAI